MTPIRTARERARAEVICEIKASGRRQLAEVGAAQLSVRAVARELGVVSSALYRYFASRDELLTALIVDAYDSLGAAVADAEGRAERDRHADRWRTAARAMRGWARAHPSEYALVFGSPVPGYRAPQETVEPFTRLIRCFLDVVSDAVAADALVAAEHPGLPGGLDSQLAGLAREVAPEVPSSVLAGAVLALSQLFGAINLELFGQLVGSLDPADAFYDYSIDRLAAVIGLRLDS